MQRNVKIALAVALAGVVAVLVLPDLWREVSASFRFGDRDAPTPFERNMLAGATIVGAFFAYKHGVGPQSRRWARAAWVASGGAWLYFARADGALRPGLEPNAATLCLAVFVVCTVGLVCTRVRRHLHGTWKPTRDFFIVKDPPPPWA
jgi:hypothetical protein